MTRPVPDLSWFEEKTNALANALPKLESIELDGRTAYRYLDRSAKQAAYLKLTRYVSSLAAGRLLAEHGFFQELGSLQRALDEIHEDLLFLTLPLFGFEETIDHARYLETFWEEEPDFKTFSSNQKNRDQVSRKIIRTYLSWVGPLPNQDHQSIMVSKYLSRIHSGSVHAAGPHCLEQYDPNTATFRVMGYPDSPFAEDHYADFENQFFRGVMNVFVVARALDAHIVEHDAYRVHCQLEPFFPHT